jgi:hypothetical protein
MRRYLCLIVGLCLVPAAFAEADYSLVQDLVGRHSLLSSDQSLRVGGTIEIVAGEAGIGYGVTPLAMASVPAAVVTVLTPQASTTLTTENGVTTQTYQNISVRYERHDGYVIVTNQSSTFVFSTGRAPGTAIATRDFIASIAGHYTIVSAGGVAPIDINSGASVDLDSDPGSADIWAPYCLSSSVCDPGEITIPYASTQVFQDGSIYTILVVRNNTLFHYSWENSGGKFTFRNFQYNFNGIPVCLEHVYQR